MFYTITWYQSTSAHNEEDSFFTISRIAQWFQKKIGQSQYLLGSLVVHLGDALQC